MAESGEPKLREVKRFQQLGGPMGSYIAAIVRTSGTGVLALNGSIQFEAPKFSGQEATRQTRSSWRRWTAVSGMSHAG
jgi:hypothetical protein